MSKHGTEKGFSVQEVELNLRRFLIVNRGSSKLTWDDVIDMFLTNKFQAIHLPKQNLRTQQLALPSINE
jgi:hypothetical protein